MTTIRSVDELTAVELDAIAETIFALAYEHGFSEEQISNYLELACDPRKVN
jgi:hypothetical protein